MNALRCAASDPMLILWALIVIGILVVGAFAAGTSWASSDHNPEKWP